MLTAIGSISSATSSNTYKILKERIDHCMEYVATQLDAKIKYYASEMNLWAHSDDIPLQIEILIASGSLYLLT